MSTTKELNDPPLKQGTMVNPPTDKLGVTKVVQGTSVDNPIILLDNEHKCDDDIIGVEEGTDRAQFRRRYCFQVIPTDPDGNCLFRSLAKHEGNPLEFHRIRHEVCNYI